jgi:hypothetical protein
MKICALLESKKPLYLADETAASVGAKLTKVMDSLAKKYQDKTAGNSSVPAGPDTSKFRAQKSGMIAVEKKVSTHSYGSTTTYDTFLKIGGNVDHKIFKACSDEILKQAKKLVDEHSESMNYACSIFCDDKILVLAETNGTNWGGIGFYVREYSKYEADMRDKYELGD